MLERVAIVFQHLMETTGSGETLFILGVLMLQMDKDGQIAHTHIIRKEADTM